MDFAKAFNKVCHSLLVHKLHHYGIHGKVNCWTENWLAGRKQAVVVESESSGSVSIKSGVPKGSVLGQGLFLYYINDLPSSLYSTTCLFADDTIAYPVIATPEDAKLLQEDLTTLEDLEHQLKMRFHPDKYTKLTLTVISKRKLVKAEPKLHEHIIASVSSAKYLGVTITEDLKWDTHIQKICNKANRTIGFLRKNLSTGAIAIKQQAYFMLVRLLVEYASTVWDPHTQINIQRLKMVQRRAARYVTNRQRNTSSISNILLSLHWWTLQYERKVGYKSHCRAAEPDILIPMINRKYDMNFNLVYF